MALWGRSFHSSERGGASLHAGVAYLPIFERIDREIATFEKQEDLIQRAKAVAARHKTID